MNDAILTMPEVQALTQLIGRPCSPAEMLWAQSIIDKLARAAAIAEMMKQQMQQQPQPAPALTPTPAPTGEPGTEQGSWLANS